MNTNLEQTDAQLPSSSNHEPFIMDVPMTVHHAIAFLDFASASTFLRFMDKQLRASERHYLAHGDGFSLGYLEGMQGMCGRFGRWRDVESDHQPKASRETSNPGIISEQQLDVVSSARFLEYLDQQLRAAEHDYLARDYDAYSLGYLEAMQDMYSWFRARLPSCDVPPDSSLGEADVGVLD
jgi:hypothetical protein